MFFLPDIPPKQEGYSRNNNAFLKIEAFWRDKKSPKTLDAMQVFGHGAGGGTPGGTGAVPPPDTGTKNGKLA